MSKIESLHVHTWVDHVVVLRPYQGHRWPGKTFSCAIDGAILKEQPSIGVWFKPLVHQVHDLDSLHQAFVSAADTEVGAGFAVRGGLINASAKSCTRGKVSRPKKPAGIKNIEQHWVVLDFDGLPNVLKIDPRKEPDRALAWVRSLLPDAFQGIRMSWQWSSSSCIGLPDDKAPEDLRLHFRVMLNQALGEKECGDLLKRLDRYVKDRLQVYGLVLPHAKKIVDPRVAIANQPHYLVRPKLTGIDDPFPGGARYGITDGVRDTVLMSDLDLELPTMAEIEAQLREERRQARLAKRAQLQLQVEEGSSAALGALDTTAPVVAMPRKKLTRLQAAFYAARQQVIDNKIQSSYERRLLDILGLVHFRRQHQVPGWERGLPEGRRAILFHVVASLIALICRSKDNLFHRMEMGHWSFRALTDYFAEDLMDDLTWYRSEWLAGNFDSTLREKIVEHRAGICSLWGDQERTPIYEYSIPRILSEFEVTEAEMIEMDLQALVSEAVRSYRRRQGKGASTREEYLARVSDDSANSTKPWEKLGISRATYYRKHKENSLTIIGETGFDRPLEKGKGEGRESEGQIAVLARVSSEPVLQQEVPVLVAADEVPFDVTMVPVPWGMVQDPDVDEVTATAGWIPLDHRRAREGLRRMLMREHVMPPPSTIAA